MSHTIETIQVGDLTVKIKQDEDASNPRTEFENVGTMVCWHGRYDLGDEQPREDASEYKLDLALRYDEHLEAFIYRLENITKRGWDPKVESWDNFYDRQVTERIRARVLRVLNAHYLFLPLYLLDHGGQRVATSDFNDRWDSGQVGFIYVSKQKALAEFGNKVFTKQVGAKALAALEGEVKCYDDYVSGNVHGYTVSRDGEVLDAGWGFYGDVEYVRQEALAAAQTYQELTPA